MSEKKLFCEGGGCTAKLGPGLLRRVLSKLDKPEVPDPNLLIGFDSSDDAAVYRIDDETAVVQTLDFFPPVVEDPYLFGRIAATNALSDLYAMGATPKTALNIVCFPENEDLNLLGEILRGGNDVVLEAGATLVGGHSIYDDTIKYGLSAMGIAHPDRIYANNRPHDKDVLILTKPLGVGIAMAADRMGACPPDAKEVAMKSMLTLNREGFDAVRDLDIHAMTDVTGFGLLGHLLEMLGDSMRASIDTIRIPKIPGVTALAEGFYLSGGAARNEAHVGDKVRFHGVPFGVRELLFDPQTSGGLLIALSEEDAAVALKRLEKSEVASARIGNVYSSPEGPVIDVI